MTKPPRLLVLACSAKKRREAGLMPARERYDGPLWRTLRAADPESARASVAFFSAKYGFACAATPIADYEARLTHADAQTMIAAFARAPRADAIAELAAGGAPFAEIALVGGRLYLRVMRALIGAAQVDGAVLRRARIVTVNGPIGIMRAELRAWLNDAQREEERGALG